MPFGPLYCENCGKRYYVALRRRLSNIRFYSAACRSKGIHTPEVNAKKANRGADHPRFVPVGTRRQWKDMPGVQVKTANGWEREHRVIANAPARMAVHHLDGDPTNNAPENLVVITQSEHAGLHMPERERDPKGRLVGV